MRRDDLPKLADRLGQLAEAFDRKPPTPGAMLVWLDVLQEFQIFDVESMLVDMPKRLTKFPSPADVWKACNERRSDRIENEARLRAREITPRPSQFPVKTGAARQEMAKIKAIISKQRPSQRAWIDRIFQRHEDGDPMLSGYALKLARDAQESFERRRGTRVDIPL